MSAIFELQTFNNTNNTDNTKQPNMATEKDIIIPVGIFGDTFSEQDAKIGVVYNQCVDKDGKMFVERLDPPMYTAPVIIDADGNFHLDRDNVVWHDPKPADGDALLDEKDVSEDLKWIFKDII